MNPDKNMHVNDVAAIKDRNMLDNEPVPFLLKHLRIKHINWNMMKKKYN